jgi:hypothetical protein
VQLADFVILIAVEHIVEPFLGVFAVVFAGGKEMLAHGRELCRFMATGE